MNRFILPLVLIIGLSGCSDKTTSDIHHLEFDSIELSKGKDKKNCKVTICHTPPAKDHEITVSCNALFAHLKHGDYLGECKSDHDLDDCSDRCHDKCDYPDDKCDDTDTDTDIDIDTDVDTDETDTDIDTDTADTGFTDTDTDDTDLDTSSRVWLQNGCNIGGVNYGLPILLICILTYLFPVTYRGVK